MSAFDKDVVAVLGGVG